MDGGRGGSHPLHPLHHDILQYIFVFGASIDVSRRQTYYMRALLSLSVTTTTAAVLLVQLVNMFRLRVDQLRALFNIN